MATNTYVALSKSTVTGSAVSSVTLSLSGITGYTDLVLVSNIYCNSTNANIDVQFNGDTGTNYSVLYIGGNSGSTTESGRASNQNKAGLAYMGANTWGNFITHIPQFSNTTTYKTLISRGNSSAVLVAAYAGLWRGSTGSSTEAITSITILSNGGSNIAVGSDFALYGITKGAEIPTTAKATGGTIVQAADGYTYHTFTSGSASFVPTQTLSCDVLIIGGGGGGMYGKSAVYAGAGGGAGQVTGYTSKTFASGITHTVAIGGGGAGATTVDTNGANGTSTTISGSGFTTLTAAGGGGGLYFTGYGGTSGNGYSGGAPDANSSGGGGGGATGVGGAGALGNGGPGTSAYSQWGNATSTGHKVSGVYYYGAGGNGQGGSLVTVQVAGGGGYYPSNKNGLANTGSGAAGANDGGGGGTGGSGLVIIRYAS